jgi:hypothetical protein
MLSPLFFVSDYYEREANCRIISKPIDIKQNWDNQFRFFVLK